LFHSLYNAASSLTGIVGLTPLDLLLGIVGLLILFMCIQVVAAFRGRTSFSLVDTYKASVQKEES